MAYIHRTGISILISCITLTSFVPSDAHAKGRRVSLLLKDSTSISGELLAVHSTSLLVCRQPWLPIRVFEVHPDTVLVIPINTLLGVHVLGHANILAGAGIGSVLGIAVGATLGNSGTRLSNDRDFNSFIGGLTGIVPGFFLGMMVGGLVETGEHDINPADLTQLQSLSEDARFQGDEPDCIQRRDAQ